jgi:hypothetical protein
VTRAAIQGSSFKLEPDQQEHYMSQESIGTKIGSTIGKVKEKLNETADRVRAEAHDINAETTENLIKRGVEKVKAAVDRLKADVHQENARTHDKDLKKR